MCAHLKHQHYWDRGVPLFHSQKPGSEKVRDHPEVTQPPRPSPAGASACLCSKCLAVTEGCWEALIPADISSGCSR